MRVAGLAILVLLAGLAGRVEAQRPDRDWTDCTATDPATAIRGCSAVIARGSRESAVNRAYALLNRGAARVAQGDAAGARSDYDQAVRLAPRDPEVLIGRAHFFDDTGDPVAARADFDRAVAANPRHAMAFNDRGFLRLEQGDARGALADFDAAAAIDPRHILFLSNRGQVRLLLGAPDQALADFDAIIRRAPESSWGHLGRAEALLALGRGKDSEAPAEAARARAAASDRPFDIVLHARALWILSRHQEAAALLDRYLEGQAAPGMTALAYRGDARLALGNVAAALSDYDAVLRRAPANPRGLMGRAAALEAAGDQAGAAEILRRAAAAGLGGAAAELARVEALIARR